MGRSGRTTGVIIAACGAAALVLTIVAAALNRQRISRSGSAAEADGTNAARRTIGILSDSHAYGRHSWWRQTIEAGTVPGLRLGPFESYPGAQTTGLVDKLGAAAEGADLVVVQAGTNDILRGRSPREAAEGVCALWDGIARRGAAPVAALIPPSDTRPALAVEVNRLIAEAARERGLPIVDVYTPVAAEDGSWARGLTNDGIHSNRSGSNRMAEAARRQLGTLPG